MLAGMPREELREQIRELLRAGRLPRQQQISTWAGPGLDQPCAACGHAVKPEDVDLQLEFDGAWQTAVYRFHTGCHAIWEAERDRAA